jgi:hypothetical protein
MIQAADVGVGIVGKEGRQASLAADFSVLQFSHLTKLLRKSSLRLDEWPESRYAQQEHLQYGTGEIATRDLPNLHSLSFTVV